MTLLASYVPGTMNDNGEDAEGVFSPFYSLHLIIILTDLFIFYSFNFNFFNYRNFIEFFYYY